ncbi:hypothetical protein [Streptosporangium sp. NPDC002721]|uniref:hypothetical protein n=1 Tax=Streptosporangium sp. NPDC002721 TaxID=3366188 RepID=UPI0036C5BB57
MYTSTTLESRHMTKKHVKDVKAPQVPPSPAELTQRLTEAAHARGLTVRQVANAILLFSRPADYSEAAGAQDQAVARSFFTGLSQLVVLMKDARPRADGKPVGLAWYWWWKGDRLPETGTSDELERLADADDIEAAADQIAYVLSLDGEPSTV